MMARGRKRKAGKRDKSGKLCKPTTVAGRRDASRVDPTPEMARKKRAADGAEIGDPLGSVALTNPQREALSRYMSARRAAGWGLPRVTANYDDPMMTGGDDAVNQEERDRKAKEFFDACDKALLGAGHQAHRAVWNLAVFRAVMGSRDDLRRGADALAGFFHIDLRDAA